MKHADLFDADLHNALQKQNIHFEFQRTDPHGGK